MKIGVEVEGRLKGIRTLFIEAETVHENLEKVRAALRTNNIGHLYISDPTGILTYEEVGRLFECHVTLDVTRTRAESRPPNISLMLRVDPFAYEWRGQNEMLVPPYWTFTDIERLHENDQLKFERNNKVYVFPMTSAILTKPEDFSGDIEL
jgi:hypothetical protein